MSHHRPQDIPSTNAKRAPNLGHRAGVTGDGESRYHRAPTPQHGDHQVKHPRDLTVATPDDPPLLTRPAARILLRILLATAETRGIWPPPEPGDTEPGPKETRQP